MSGPWIRVPPDRGDDAQAFVVAAALAAGVGVVAFYLTRILLAREELAGGPAPGKPEGRPGDGMRA